MSKHIEDKRIRLARGDTGFLLIHGLGGTPIEMRYIVVGLARAGYTVHVPQLAGHCGSADDLTRTGWTDWYNTVEEEYRLLREKGHAVVAGVKAFLTAEHVPSYLQLR